MGIDPYGCFNKHTTEGILERMKELILFGARPFVWLYDHTHWFTDKEAWALYRFFAIGEAVGWTLLIVAIVYRSLGLPQAASVISFAGHIHGILFGFYFLFVLLTARSMKWGVWRIGGALAAGIPPYTAIVYEQIMAQHRKRRPVFVVPPRSAEE